MSSVQNALRFWKIVELSLVELYGCEPELAKERVLRVRGRMTEHAIAQDVVYHSQPLHVADDIAYTGEQISDDILPAYHAIVQRVNGTLSSVEELPQPEPRKGTKPFTRETHVA